MLKIFREEPYGFFWKGKERDSQNIVAIKEVLLKDPEHVSGFPTSSIREINILKRLKHENIVVLKEVCSANKR